MATITNKKRLVLILFTLIALILVSCSSLSVSANMAEPNYNDTNSGIVFSKNQSIGVESEVLNINLTQYTASVEAVYNLKNESENAISLDAMFLAPIGGEHAYETFENDIAVELAGEQIDYTTNYYFSKDYAENYTDLNNWQEVLASYEDPYTIFGDGSGYKIFSFSGDGELDITFSPSTHYFVTYDDGIKYTYDDDGTSVTISASSYEYGQSFISIISDLNEDDFDVKVGGVTALNMASVQEIDDIYDYLYENGTAFNQELDADQKVDEDILKFRFSEYLYQISSLDTYYLSPCYFFEARYAVYDTGFIGAICYSMDFDAGEQKQLKVSYLSGTGGYSYRDTKKIDFSYLLTPASYWSSFGGIEINLTVPSDINQINSSSLEFERISETQFQFKAESLPSDELAISLSNVSNIQTFLYEVVCIIGMFVCPLIFIATSAVFVTLRRNKKYVMTASFALILAVLSLIFGSVWSYILQMTFGAVGVFFDEMFIIVAVALFALGETLVIKYKNNRLL